MTLIDTIALAWLAVINAVTLLAFGADKWRARRAGRRVPEFTLLTLSALGGWPGGLLGMIAFRHKTAKWTFQLGFAFSLIPCAAAVWAWFHWR